jgi:actin-like protein 6A
VNAIVIDIGTYQVKAGYAGEDAPKFISPSAVGLGGEPIGGGDGASKMEVDGEGVYRAGTQALEIRRDGMEVVSPFENGILKEWDAVEALWDHTFK